MAGQKAIAIIPARLGSTRFPGKALASETGKPMVVHVCERAAMADSVSRVVVATDSGEIAEAVKAGGFESVMTSTEHLNGTSRLAEAVRTLGLKSRQAIVNVQGDEPEISPDIIDAALLGLGVKLNACWEVARDPRLSDDYYPAASTVASPIADDSEATNPNVVKVVLTIQEPDSGVGTALYFTRSAVPYVRDGGVGIKPLKHVGIYAYQVHDLLSYVKLPATPLEQCEQLEQLRWLEHGLPVAVAIRQSNHQGIDTPEQYAAFVERYRTRTDSE